MEYLPLAGVERVEKILRYPWPSPDCYDYASFASEIDTARALYGDKAVMVVGGNPFEIYCWMTGLEEALINLVVQPEIVRCALEHICGFFLRRLERIAQAAGDRIDLWFFADDLGGQNGLLMSRTAYRRALQPFHRRLFSAARRLTPDAFIALHTDGAVFEIVPDLLDAGVEVLEAVQVDCLHMEPERLAEAYGDRLSFHGGISVQNLLPFTDPQTVTRECQRLLRTLGAGGGYIAAPSHAIQVHTPVANVLAMLRSVLGEEEYVRAIAASAL
jgi:uroporphyrinogen decarboxylase